MTGYELRLIDGAIASILMGEYWNATQADVDEFLNNLRKHLSLKVRIVNEDGVHPLNISVSPNANIDDDHVPKLSQSTVEYIRNSVLSIAELAEQLCVSKSTVANVRAGRSWTRVTKQKSTRSAKGTDDNSDSNRPSGILQLEL
jgi:hypothetical protein